MRREIYVSWVAFYEGRSDSAYYDVLLPRLMEEITLAEPVRAVRIPQTPAYRVESGRKIAEVASDLCRNSGSFSLIFVHADTGGRAQLSRVDDHGHEYCRAIHARCRWPLERCITLQPRHETEAWVLADPDAVMAALGMRSDPSRYGFPADAAAAEALPDAKGVLNRVIRNIVGRRKSSRGSTALLARVAQMQSLTALRGSHSFRAFEAKLRRGLVDLGCLPR